MSKAAKTELRVISNGDYLTFFEKLLGWVQLRVANGREFYERL